MFLFIYLAVFCIISAAFCVVAGKKEGKYFSALPPKDHPLRFFYPAGYLLSRLAAQYFVPQKDKGETKERLKALYPTENIEERLTVYQAKKAALPYVMLLVFHILALCYAIANYGSSELNQKNEIVREDYGGDDKTLTIDVVGRQEGNQVKEEISLTVGAMEYTPEEVQAQMDAIEQALKTQLRKSNESLEEVTTDLNMITSWEKSPVRFNWYSSNPEIISEEGIVSSKGLSEAKDVRLELTLTWKDMRRSISYEVHVLPVKQSLKEQVLDYLENGLQEEEKSARAGSVFALPLQYKGYQLYYREKTDHTAVTLLFVGVIAGVAGFALSDQEEKKLKAYREKQMQMDYPELVSKFTLLVSAGLTVRNAWEKLTQDYRDKRKEGGELHYAYEEMGITMQELKNGVVEQEAYERFGRRSKVLPYMRFGSLLGQNVKKGSKGLTELLEQEGQNAFEERKQTAKRLGEEAGTKLLFPMMLFLMIVLAIVMVPAMMGM